MKKIIFVGATVSLLLVLWIIYSSSSRSVENSPTPSPKQAEVASSTDNGSDGNSVAPASREFPGVSMSEVDSLRSGEDRESTVTATGTAKVDSSGPDYVKAYDVEVARLEKKIATVLSLGAQQQEALHAQFLRQREYSVRMVGEELLDRSMIDIFKLDLRPILGAEQVARFEEYLRGVAAERSRVFAKAQANHLTASLSLSREQAVAIQEAIAISNQKMMMDGVYRSVEDTIRPILTAEQIETYRASLKNARPR